MTDIMKLADDCANACADVREFLGANAGMDEADGTWIASQQARAALQSAIEALQSKLGDAIQSSAHWQHQFTELQAENVAMNKPHIERLLRIETKVDELIVERDQLQAENERLKQEREKDAFRLVWAMNWMRMSVHDHGFTEHVLGRGGTADYSDCATYIDKCAGATQEAAHGIGGTQ